MMVTRSPSTSLARVLETYRNIVSSVEIISRSIQDFEKGATINLDFAPLLWRCKQISKQASGLRVVESRMSKAS